MSDYIIYKIKTTDHKIHQKIKRSIKPVDANRKQYEKS